MGESSFWYRPTRVVLDQRPLNGRCCVVVPAHLGSPGQRAVKRVCVCATDVVFCISSVHVCHRVCTHTHPCLTAPFFRDYLGEPVPEGKTNLDFTEARDSECKWHQLAHMQVCNSLPTDNHASTPPLSFYRLDALPATQPTVSKH